MSIKEFFEKAREKNFSNIQITEKHTIDSSVEIINGEIESFEDYDNINYSIKSEYNGKTVKASSNYLEEEVLDTLIEKAIATDTNYEDEYLSGNRQIPKNTPLSFDISEEIKRCKKLDHLREEYSSITKLTCYYSETYTNTRIVSMEGVDISTDSHLCNFMVEAIAQKEDETTSFDDSILTTKKEEIPFEEFTRNVMEKAVLQSQKEKIETGKYEILLSSRVASRIISHLTDMLSASSIRNKVSCMENKIGKQVFHPSLTIIEDPRNKDMPGFRLFDDEGWETSKKTVVRNGIVESIFYNIKEAKIKNQKSTGNGYQGIGTRNMYVVPGEKNFKNLLESIKDGIYITDYMGASGTSINSNNGQISLQIFGFRIKDGKLVRGIEPSIMTTTIFELLSNIEEIGSDLKTYSLSTSSPSIQVKQISIAR